MFSPSKLFTAALVLAMIASPALAAPPRCTPGSADVKIRKEWRTLSVPEKQAYFKAFDAMIASGFYDELANTHNIHNNYIHGNPLFLPWHRAFTVVVEVEMRKTAGPNFALPYWDWGYDSQAPELSPHWGDDDLSFGRGGDGRGCVRTGHFRNYRPRYTGNDCLTRDFRGTIDPVTSTDLLNSLMSNSRQYDSFRRNLEGRPHAGVHVNIGGDMGIMTSPSDPVFFLHHAMVDKIWNDWQKLRPENRNMYDGRQSGFRDVRSGPASTSHILYPYTDWTVGDTFDPERLCFKYANLNVNDIRVNNLPPPTVVRPTGTTAQPTVAQPVTQPAPVSQPVSRPPPSRPSFDEDRDDDREDRHSSSGKKISRFFKDLFNDGQVDPSQAPIGQSGPKVEPAPVDSKVKLDFNEKAPAESVKKDDRSELIKLREQPAIPEKWLKLNNLDVNEVRAYEKEEKKIIQKLNNVFGYISPSALWNQVEKVATLAKSGIKKFEATLSSVVVTVESSTEEANKNGLQAVVDIHARVKLSIGFTQLQNIEKVTPQVSKIIGPEVYGKDAASNPFRARNVKTKAAPTTSAV